MADGIFVVCHTLYIILIRFKLCILHNIIRKETIVFNKPIRKRYYAINKLFYHI